MRGIPVLVLMLAWAARAIGATYVVAPSAGDFTQIQVALDVAVAGDTVQVRTGTYFEKLTFPRSGNAVDGHITLTAYPGEQPIVDGTGVSGENMMLLESRSWIRIVGFEIRNALGVSDGSGIRLVGAGSHVEIRDNAIHDVRGTSAMGITVYGTEATPISDLVIDGNTVRDCEPAPSEAITLNGNVDGFAVTNNVVRDVNNIGIDFIGGETDIQPDPAKVARNGVCRGNRVERARSSYGGGFAGGIYVDGGRDIVIENNVVTESDLGLEVGAENSGIETRNVVVRNNVLHANDKAGLVFGGFAASVGRVRDCAFTNNTLVGNDTLGAGFGELWIQYAEDNVVRNNVFVATTQRRLLTSDAGNTGNTLDYNLWWTADGLSGTFVWNGDEHGSFAAYAAATGADAHSLFADPLLTGGFHLGPSSPAMNAGDPSFVAAPGEVDLDGAPRVSGPRVDIGADEVTCGDGTTNPGEECDDGDTIDGDGCDSNCTVTACGNGIAIAGEACDDGNLIAGDCCAPTCSYEASGTSCDDGDTCTTTDQCDGAGACAGAEVPRTGCHVSLRPAVQLKNLTPDTKDKLTWKWVRGDIDVADLGDPVGGGTAFTLCTYDTTAGVSSIVGRQTAPAGGTCRGKPCWKPIGPIGFKYSDRDLTPHGIQGILAKSGSAGRASVKVKGKGGRLLLPPLPLAQGPRVTIQLVATTGACWESTHGAPAIRNDDTQFKDGAD
jgi:cysteine-rich repeat protein